MKEKIEKKIVDILDMCGFWSDTSKKTSEVELHDLGMDSLDMIELVLEIEKEYSITIPDSVVDGWSTGITIGSVTDYVEKACQNKQ